ncbi:MAG: preprotein translocase subunit SecE [Thermomicrobiales bacterium]
MSAQRRTATKRGATATVTPPAPKRAAPQESKLDSTKGGARPASAKAKAPETRLHPLKRRVESLQRTFRETRAEMSKITWPDQQTTRNLTIVVIGLSIVLGLFLGGIDYVLLKILEKL